MTNESLKMTLEDYHQIKSRFNGIKDLDSMAFVEIPFVEIRDNGGYRKWLIDVIENGWFKGNDQNNGCSQQNNFNDECLIKGEFSGLCVNRCILYRLDGTLIRFNGESFPYEEINKKRGYLIKDHYSPFNVVKVQVITDNLCEFLAEKDLEHYRTNFKR